jgi:hypothetical protein
MSLTANPLAELIERRRDCLSELLGFARRQGELATAGDMDGLLELLHHKQPRLEALERISRALKPFQDEDAEERTWPDASSRAACQRLWEECDAMHRELVELERAGEAALRERRDQISRRLDTNLWTQAIHSVYLQGTQPLAFGAGTQLDIREQ